MSNSLQEQLVQAGLADPDSQKKSASKKKGKRRKPDHRGQGRSQGGAEPQRGADGDTRVADAATGGGDAPRREPTAAERAERVRRMVRSNRIDRKYAAVPYRFTQGSRIREVAVTASQQGRLARGELGIVAVGERFELVPAKVARQVRGIEREAVVVLNTGREAEDDPEHRVPDDLRW